MYSPRPLLRARELRRTGSQLIFAWGSVVSALWYALLTIRGTPPLLDHHITATAVTMLLGYLLMRVGLDLWVAWMRRRHPR